MLQYVGVCRCCYVNKLQLVTKHQSSPGGHKEHKKVSKIHDKKERKNTHSNNEKPIESGYLEKLGGPNNSYVWQKRWFVLYPNNKFVWFRTDSSNKPRNSAFFTANDIIENLHI